MSQPLLRLATKLVFFPFYVISVEYLGIYVKTGIVYEVSQQNDKVAEVRTAKSDARQTNRPCTLSRTHAQIFGEHLQQTFLHYYKVNIPDVAADGADADGDEGG